MEFQPNAEPGSCSNDEMNLANMNIQGLVSFMRTAYRTEQFDRVEEILVSRYNKMKIEIQLLQEKCNIERLVRIHIEEDLEKIKKTCQRCKRAERNYEKLLMEVKKTGLIDELKKKENGNDTVEPDEDEPPNKRSKDAAEVSVDEGAEDTEEGDDEESDELRDESSYEDEITKQSQRKGKRKVGMHFDTTQPKFSGSNKIAMVKAARKYPTSGTVNENPFFEITLSHHNANGYNLWLPSKFSREHLMDYKGPATIWVGKEMAVEVSLGFYNTCQRSIMSSGWKIFREKYNLQVDDHCKFEMIHRRPASFTVTITRGRNGPSPKKLPGVSYGNNLVKKKDIGETSSRSRPKENFLEDMSQNQNQGNVQGDEKKKEKSPMTWHRITCDGSVKKKDSKVTVYNQTRLRRIGRTYYFGPQPKAGAAGTVAGNPIDL